MKKNYYIIESSDSETCYVSTKKLSYSEIDDGRKYLSPYLVKDIREAQALSKVEANKLLKLIKSELNKAFGDCSGNDYKIIQLL